MPSILNIAHMCSHLNNASRARLGITSIKNTKYNLMLALAMHRAGFFSAIYRGGPTPPTMEQMLTEAPEPVTEANVASRRLWLGLKYWEGKPVLNRTRMVSKSQRLVTASVPELERLVRGFPSKVSGGVMPGLSMGECMFLGTDRGVLEVREALEKQVGGLVICKAS